MQQAKLWMLATVLIFCGTIDGFGQQRPKDLKGIPGTWVFIAKLSNPDDTLLVIPTDNMKEVKTVVRDQNGAFLYHQNDLSETKTFFMLTPSTVKGAGGFSLLIDAVPGEVLSVQGFCENGKPADGLTFDGSAFYEIYGEAYAIKNKVRETKDAQSAIDFVKAHSASEVCAVLVGSVGCYAPSRLDEMLSLLSPEVRNGRMKAYIDKEIEDAKMYVQQKEMENSTLKVGSQAPDFTLNDINGQPFTLSSMRDKFILLDFWGSWCTWCIKGFPEMKTYYEKYKDKIEIIGMDCNDTEAKWKKAVADNELPWKHVFVPRGSHLLIDYMVTAFPTKIFLSPDGKVVRTFIGESPEFYDYLDSVLGEE